MTLPTRSMPCTPIRGVTAVATIACVLGGLTACVVAPPLSSDGRFARVELRQVAAPCIVASSPPRRLIRTSGSGGRVLFCNEGGCLADVTGSGAVVIRCGAGRCDVNASGSGSRLLVCPGGDCSMTCRGSGSCAIVGCRGGCSMRCSGSGTCDQPTPRGRFGLR